jgi:periplasmic protein TonB
MNQLRSLRAILLGMLLMASSLQGQKSESHPDTGIIYGQQYVNSYFGFSYRFPAGWSGNAARLTMASQIYPLFTASPTGGGNGSYIAIQAEQLRQRDNIKTSKDFLEMSVGMLTGGSSGFEALPGDKHYFFGNKEFDRIDIRSQGNPGDPMVRQALVCAVLRDYAVTFQFKATNDTELEELVSTMLTLSFLDSGQSSAPPNAPAVAARVANQPAVVVSTPAVVAPVTATAVPSRVISQSPAAPATTTPVRTASVASIQPAAQMKSAPVTTKTESAAVTSAGGAVPSALIKMTPPAHTLVGETLPPTQPIEPVSQPLVKAEPKQDVTTKAAVIQAVMPAPSAELSPVAVNTATQPAAPLQKPAEAPANKTTQAVANKVPVISPALKTEITRVQVPAATLESYVTRKVPAAYPYTARQARIEGLVVLSIVVDEKGNVQEVKAISGPAVLARSAEDALRHWRFNPIIVDGKPTKIESRVSMDFELPH